MWSLGHCSSGIVAITSRVSIIGQIHYDIWCLSILLGSVGCCHLGGCARWCLRLLAGCIKFSFLRNSRSAFCASRTVGVVEVPGVMNLCCDQPNDSKGAQGIVFTGLVRKAKSEGMGWTRLPKMTFTKALYNHLPIQEKPSLRPVIQSYSQVAYVTWLLIIDQSPDEQSFTGRWGHGEGEHEDGSVENGEGEYRMGMRVGNTGKGKGTWYGQLMKTWGHEDMRQHLWEMMKMQFKIPHYNGTYIVWSHGLWVTWVGGIMWLWHITSRLWLTLG